MGNQASDQHMAKHASGPLASSISVSGRYHRPPKTMEDDYLVAKDGVLGTGYNGAVYKATGRHTTDRTFAVKSFSLNGIPKAKKTELKEEAEIFLQMDHPHVARLIAVYENEKILNLVMECMEGGELFERLVAKKHYSERDAAHCVWQMLLAVNYIHSHGVVHRDLKLENFLYESKSGDHLKLIDFGFSKLWDTNTKMKLSCGTLAYVAPEVLDRSYTAKCDLWSLGVVCFILILGYMPFDGAEAVQMASIRAGSFRKKSNLWDRMSPTAQDFITSLMNVDPLQRLSAEQALKHEWIAERDQTGRYNITPLARLDSGAAGKGTLNVDDGTLDALCNFAQASKFRRACMSLMAWSLTTEERAMVRDAFIELDTERQGTIKLVQLKEVLQAKFDIEDENVKPLIDSLSAANGEEIHYSEFLAAMMSTRIAMHEDHLMETFRRFDTDNSGFINQQDLRNVLGDSFNEEDMAKLIHDVDPTDSGQISYAQFVEYLRRPDVDESYSSAALRLIDNAENEASDKALGTQDKKKLRASKVAGEGGAAAAAMAEAGNDDQTARQSKACAIL